MNVTGFVGVYATLGLPAVGQAPKIAFQIPVINVGGPGYHRDCFFGAHKKTFRSLVSLFRFPPPILDPSSRHKTPGSTTLYGDWSWAERVQVDNANLIEAHDAYLESYENYGSFNATLTAGRRYRVHVETISGRTVFYADFT
jgi:hypothetical protein